MTMPLKPRPVPPVLADHVAWPTAENRDAPKPGVIYSNNVYQNAPEALRGMASRHRSPLVWRAVADYLGGSRHPLDLVRHLA